MSFMYLSVRTEDDIVRATLQDDGSLKLTTLGHSHSRATHAPSLVLRIDSFDGLDAIDSGDLLSELQRRFSVLALLDRLAVKLSNDELLDMLRLRLPNG